MPAPENTIEGYLAKHPGFTPRYKYRVTLTTSPTVTIPGIFPGDRCIDTTLPGRYLATTEHRYIGPTTKHPYNTYYDDITMLFICDEKMTERNYFARWLESIYDNKYNMNYKDEYKADILIEQFNHDAETVYSARLNDAFPLAIEGSPLNYGSASEAQNFQVRFNYRDFIEGFHKEHLKSNLSI